MGKQAILLVTGFGLVLTVGACRRSAEVRDIPELRVEKAGGSDFGPEADTATRLGFRSSRPQMLDTPAKPGIEFDLPPGWKELPPSGMRLLNLQIGDAPEVQCSLTTLGGDAGGLLANVNRWRGQIGLDGIQVEELAALPRAALAGKEAVLLELEGTFAGMSGSQNKAGWAMLGLLAVAREGSVFLKAVGPAATMKAEKEHFMALGRSIRMKPAAPAQGDPHAGMGDGMPRTGPSAAQAARGALAWDLPKGWTEKQGHEMRLASFAIDGSDQTECYLFPLGGDGGGTLNNVNRWRGQMGLEPVDGATLAQAPRVQVLGHEVALVEIAGSFQGMSGPVIAEAEMLAVMVELGDRALTVKLTGPKAVVQKSKDRFVAFVRSLRFE
ncbi:MAG: hypothetical protein R3F30_15865 [Planctomycetota bacterium]